MKWSPEDAERGVSKQRYKVGEMNPEQLWKTTMDASVRRLLTVRIKDAIDADGILLHADGRRCGTASRIYRKQCGVCEQIDIHGRYHLKKPLRSIAKAFYDEMLRRFYSKMMTKSRQNR